MLSQLRPALLMVLIMTLLLGIFYPWAVTGIARLAFPAQANGSLVERDGKVIGSYLIGQSFTGARYFHGRPSAAGQGYDAAASGGSNFGPTSKALIGRVKDSVVAWHQEGERKVPIDLVTASGSGLDPDITPAAAQYQVARVARVRGLPVDQVEALVTSHIDGRQLGFLGEKRVNVLSLNLALDTLQKP